MEFRLLGVLEALDDELPISLGGPKQRSVLAMLLLEPGRPVSTDRLVDGLWGDNPPLRAAGTLQVYVSHLRKALEPDRSPRAEPAVLLTRAPGYVLAVDPGDVDLFRAERMLTEARAMWSEGCAAGASVLFCEALALWRGAPFADLADEPFARFEVPRLEEVRLGAIEDRLDADLALGRDADLVPELERLVAQHPLRERLHRQLMLALYRSGRQADALEVYQSARRTLVEELGIEPSRELRELEAAILAQDPTLESSAPSALRDADVERVLLAAVDAEVDASTVESIVDASQTFGPRAEQLLRETIDAVRASRLSASLRTADEKQLEVVRARRVIADQVLDRRRRQAPAPSRAERAGSCGRDGSAHDACPYRGLLRFEPEDVGWYFGRERLVAELLATVASNGVTGVVGESGSGKSSLARAGLLAALAADALPGSDLWPRLLITPGRDPVRELARALAPISHSTSADQVHDRLREDPASIIGFIERATDGADDRHVMIVVDQLEELFTVCDDDGARACFQDALVHAAHDAAPSARVLVVVRSDYFGRCAEHSALAESLVQSTLLVAPMRHDELVRAIEAPAQRAGLTLEAGLVDQILDDVGTEPGALPLLETALLETWHRRRTGTLTIDGYESAGGVRGALAHLADAVYERLPEADRPVARSIFLRLAEPGVGNDDVRRRAPLDELLTNDRQVAVLSTLVESRLVVTGDTTAEVAHEALLREWPRLRGWLEADREGRKLHRGLSISAQEWEASGRDRALLFRGSRLAAVQELANADPARINPLERDFLAASRHQQDADLRSARSTARRFRRLTAGLALLLVVAVVAVALSLVERSRADDNASRAASQSVVSDAALLALRARALADDRLDVALLLAAQAYRMRPSIESEGALETALLAAPSGIEQLVAVDDPGTTWPAISNDARLLAVPGGDGIVRLLDASTGRLVRRLRGPRIERPLLPQFDALATRVALGNHRGDVTVWDVASGRRLGPPLRSTREGPAYATFDPTDVDRLYVAGSDGTVTRWQLDGQRPARSVELFSAGAYASSEPLALSVSPDGRMLIVSDITDDGSTSLWDLDRRTKVADVLGSAGSWDGGGTTFSTSWRGFVDVWDASGQARTQIASASPGPRASLSTDGSRVAITDRDTNRIRVVDVASGRDVVDPITLHTSEPLARFLPDGRLFTASAERVVVFRLDGTAVPPLATVLTGPTGTHPRAAFTSVDRDVVTIGSGDGTRIWRVPEGDLTDELADPDHRSGVVVPSRDLRRAAVLDPDGTIRLWDVERGTAGAALRARAERPVSLDWSPDGSLLVVTFPEDAVLWRVEDLRAPRRIARLEPRVGSVDQPPQRTSTTFSPDGRLVVIVRESFATATVFDTSNGNLRHILAGTGNGAMSEVAFSPDGRTLAAAVIEPSGTGSVLFFDAETGADRDPLRIPYGPKGIAFAGDGRRFVTVRADDSRDEAASGRGSVQVWDTDTRSAIGEPMPLDAVPIDLEASDDGVRVVHRTDAGYSVVWDVEPAHWNTLACRIAGRQLTRQEWQRYLPSRPFDPACSS